MIVFDYLRSKALHCVSRAMFPETAPVPVTRLGSGYGGWWVPLEWLGPGSICYGAGVGEDITFDLALIAARGVTMHAFDPTPRAAAHVKAVAASESRLVHHPEGLWKTDTVQRFYAPSDPRHVSHSILNLQNTDTYFDARCRRLSSKMRELGHAQLDLLKLDIEGAAHAVIATMFEDGIRPRILCVEFDQPSPYADTVRTLRALRAYGYEVAVAEGWNWTLLVSDGANGSRA